MAQELLTVASRIQDAKLSKEEGNRHFQEGNWKRASFHYKMVHMHLGDLITPPKVSPKEDADMMKPPGDPMVDMLGKSRKVNLPPEVQKEILDIYIATQSNLSMSHYKLGRHAEAADRAKFVLKYQPENPKGHFRLGCAKMGLGDLDEAKVCFGKVLSLVPDDPGANQKLHEIAELEARAASKEKKMCAKMFGA